MLARMRAQLKRPIVSNKEIVDGTFLIVAGGVTTDIALASTIQDYVGTVGTCPQGTRILGFYVDVSTNNVDNIIGRTDWYLCKVNGGQSITNFPTPGSSGGVFLRKWIFHEEKGIFQGAPTTAGGNASRGRQFLRIPKGYMRMGEGDKWFIRVGSSENYSFCIKCIYKWYQ